MKNNFSSTHQLEIMYLCKKTELGIKCSSENENYNRITEIQTHSTQEKYLAMSTAATLLLD